MDIKLELSQQQVLSQKMIQSAMILQMNAQELETYLKETAVDNPVIDLEEIYEEPDKDKEIRSKLEWLAGSDEQNRAYYSQDRSGNDRQDMGNLSDIRGEDLISHLRTQLLAHELSREERKTAEYIIGTLDSRGYFTESIEAVAYACHTDTDTTARMLGLVQQLEPGGVAARNLEECLLLQMDRLCMGDDTCKKIVRSYLPELGKNQLPYIAKQLKISLDEVCCAAEIIKALNPKPGNSFSSNDNIKIIIPDVRVTKLGDAFEVVLNEHMFPRISINRYYLDMMKAGGDEQTREYVGNKIRQAEWVMQCVSQRSKTLLNVSRVMVERQKSFFLEGPGHLAPLKLSDVALEIGVHESTVSRAVREKYLQCCWGVFPMNYLFTGAILQDSGATTADTAKRALREIIAAEDVSRPYSDRLLAEKLMERGINISRRTVAKYRDSMGIKDAGGRKLYKKT